EHLRSDNLTQELKDRGLLLSSGIKLTYDNWGNFGGPVKTDRLWFFTAARILGSRSYVAGLYENKDPKAWTYTQDLSRPAIYNEDHKDIDARLPWKASPKNKFSVWDAWQPHCICHYRLYNGNLSPEAAAWLNYAPNDLLQLTWK